MWGRESKWERRSEWACEVLADWERLIDASCWMKWLWFELKGPQYGLHRAWSAHFSWKTLTHTDISYFWTLKLLKLKTMNLHIWVEGFSVGAICLPHLQLISSRPFPPFPVHIPSPVCHFNFKQNLYIHHVWPPQGRRPFPLVKLLSSSGLIVRTGWTASSTLSCLI